MHSYRFEGVITTNISDRIRLRRIELGMTQQELCTKMGYTNHSTITKIEQGLVDISFSKIAQFASVLGVTVEYLIGIDSNTDCTSPPVEPSQNMSLGMKIKQARLAKGLTQEELGDLLGVQKSAVAKYENGRIINLKHETLQKLTKILNLSLTDLVSPETPSLPSNAVTTSEQGKSDVLSIILRLSTDAAFLETVEMIHALDHDKLVALQRFFENFIVHDQISEKK